ncbi:MAG: hypothetical protein AMS18_05545 [Gemmatimonas sp. SG8_17]|nr:MAG: hypothetical protein AMS18_05545 [Gemmatimonas sp. SG8_17]
MVPDLQGAGLEMDMTENTGEKQAPVATGRSSGREPTGERSQECEEPVAAPTVLAGFDWFLFGIDGEYLGAIHAPSLRPVIGRHAPSFLLGGRPTVPVEYGRPAAQLSHRCTTELQPISGQKPTSHDPRP